MPTVASLPADRVRSAARRRARRLERQLHRRVLAVGHRARCPVCGWHGTRFAPSSNPRRPDRICPGCQSNERSRALALWLADRGPAAPGQRLLEIAPIGLVAPIARPLGYRYTSLDLASPRAETRGDLARLSYRDAAFDLVACLHVLEHVGDDFGAAGELARVLTPDGVAVVVVPWEPHRAETFEDPDAGPADRERLYGQADHVRTYGRDFPDRMAAGGLAVEERRWTDLFTADQHRAHRLTGDDDRFWLGRPEPAPPR